MTAFPATASAIAATVNAGGSALPLVEESLRRCAADTTNALVRHHPQRARERAAVVDARIRAGERLPLAGVPLVVKDNLLVEGCGAEACSRILEGFVAPYTASAVARLEAAGAIVVAHANMDEFAMGSSNESSCRGPVRHPLDPTRIPGGSSGGSAVAVAAGLAPLALGSDTGGSIRQPAGLCGVVGFKPTYGRISRYGLIAYGSSLDQIGPLATTVVDADLALRVMAGRDPADSTSAERPLPAPLPADPRAALRGLRVGYVAAHEAGLAADVRARLIAAKAALSSAGATLVPVELPNERHAIAVYYILATGEAASNLSRFDGIRYGRRAEGAKDLGQVYARSRAEGFGSEVQRRIMLGTYVLSTGFYDAYYRKAQQVRTLIIRDFAAVFAACDVLLGPISPTTAFRAGEKTSDPLQMYLADIFTISANLAGIPAVAVPAGSGDHGLPVGLQFHGPAWSDDRVLAAGAGLAAVLGG
jgi:aspartyl-tRNA(Asn)/glutamyl-tRNA(Gln) amidotransferase subunit A